MEIATSSDLSSRRHLLGDVIGFDPVSLTTPPNVSLKSGENVGIFEYESPGVYQGHYLFVGGDKLADAREMLSTMFSSGVEVIKGLTPVDNKAALWMTRRLGFTLTDVVKTDVGDMQLSYLIKEKK